LRVTGTTKNSGNPEDAGLEGGLDDGLDDDGSHVDIVRRPPFGRMLHSMRGLVLSATSRAVESVTSDFHARFEPLFEGWHNKRLAWIGPAILLGIEYGLGLAMGFGAMASCESEQVRISATLVLEFPLFAIVHACICRLRIFLPLLRTSSSCSSRGRTTTRYSRHSRC
jgi:hypothetical protein